MCETSSKATSVRSPVKANFFPLNSKEQRAEDNLTVKKKKPKKTKNIYIGGAFLFRYIPSEDPPIISFPIDGVFVNVSHPFENSKCVVAIHYVVLYSFNWYRYLKCSLDSLLIIFSYPSSNLVCWVKLKFLFRFK